MKNLISDVLAKLSKYSDSVEATTLKVKTFGLTKIPLIFAVNPSVLLINDKECKIKIPLNRITRNHHKSMYFGALAIGADLAGGLLAMNAFKKRNIHFLFKDVNAQFLKRCESAAVFHCADGSKVNEAVKKLNSSGQRVNIPLTINVYAPETLGDEPCANFQLTLSIKEKITLN